MRADHVRAEAGARLQRPPERKRLRLALHLNRLQALELEHALRRPERLLRHRHAVHRRRGLQPRRRVHHITGHDPLALPRTRPERHNRLARVDPHPHLQGQGRIGLVQLADRLHDPQPGPHRPSASSSCATGAPNTAITASPTNFSTVAP